MVPGFDGFLLIYMHTHICHGASCKDKEGVDASARAALSWYQTVWGLQGGRERSLKAGAYLTFKQRGLGFCAEGLQSL